MALAIGTNVGASLHGASGNARGACFECFARAMRFAAVCARCEAACGADALRTCYRRLRLARLCADCISVLEADRATVRRRPAAWCRCVFFSFSFLLFPSSISFRVRACASALALPS